MNKRRKIVVFIFGCFVALLVATIQLPVITGPTRRTAATTEFAHARQVFLALKRYADQHGARYPHMLSDLPADCLSPAIRQFHDPKTKKAEDWIYYGDYTQNEPKATIILASPQMVEFGRTLKRIAICEDHDSPGFMDENAFVQQISKQLINKGP